MPEEKTYKQTNPPNVARGDSAIWIRDDGTTYRKGAGGHSWAVHTVEKKPKPEATPDPDKGTSNVTAQSKAGVKTGGQAATRRAQEKAQTDAEKAEDSKKYAPWLSEDSDTGTGGLGDRAAVAQAGRASAQDAGDAVAADSDKKKKKKEDE